MKNKTKKLTKISILLTGILLLFTSCQEQETISPPENNQGKYLLTRVYGDEIKNNIFLTEKLSELKHKKGAINGYAARYDNVQFNLNLNEAAYIESADGSFHSYTFSIYNEDDSYDINNIVLVSRNGQDYEAYLSTYALTEEERTQLVNGFDIDLETKASIEPFDINQINMYSKEGGGGGCFDLVGTGTYTDCTCHDVHAEGGCTHPSEIMEWVEEPCPGNYDGGGGSGIPGSSGTPPEDDGSNEDYSDLFDGDDTENNDDPTENEDSEDEIIPTTPMYPDGTSAAPDFLINTLGGTGQLTDFQLNWIQLPSNDYVVNMFLEFYSKNTANPEETKAIIKELITFKPEKDLNALNFMLEAYTQDKIYNNIDSDFLLSVNQYMELDVSSPELHDPVIIHLMMKMSLIRAVQPNICDGLSEWQCDIKVFWEATKDVVHIVLDGIGLVPVVGEAADLINGGLYLLEGDGVNATLSFAATIPFAGWAATGSKYAIKILEASTIGTKIKLTWKVLDNGSIYFGSSGSKLRKVLGITDSALQAHHIMPWADVIKNHDVIQKAAKSGSAFHMNEPLNGIAVASWRNQPNHFDYTNVVKGKLDEFNTVINPNATVDEAYDFVNDLIQDIRDWVINNPNSHLNDLVLP